MYLQKVGVQSFETNGFLPHKSIEEVFMEHGGKLMY